MTIHQAELPYGVDDLDPVVRRSPDDPDKIGCFVRGCTRFVRRPTRGSRGHACPEHGIYCHVSDAGATYCYRDGSRNLIVDAAMAAELVFANPFKHGFERPRHGYEKSEDALSWNVFRSLQRAGLLHRAARLVVPDAPAEEPVLFLWGLRCGAISFEPWELLIAARRRFESNLPVERPLTEPDIMLWLPGRYLVLIEAKFTSPNTYYCDGPRKDPQSLTKQELIAIYQDEAVRTLNYEQGAMADKIPYQLWRNMVFAEWMSAHDAPTTIAYHANLTRAGAEEESQATFRGLLRPEHERRFAAIIWNQLHAIAVARDELKPLCRYLETKTAGLAKALAVTVRNRS